jgi:hypothetical protein
MPSLWITALQQYNGTKGPWCIPRKGTKEYDEVKSIMESKKTKAKKIESKPEVKAEKQMETPKKAEPAKEVKKSNMSKNQIIQKLNKMGYDFDDSNPIVKALSKDKLVKLLDIAITKKPHNLFEYL